MRNVFHSSNLIAVASLNQLRHVIHSNNLIRLRVFISCAMSSTQAISSGRVSSSAAPCHLLKQSHPAA
jgi:hypothetical protein